MKPVLQYRVVPRLPESLSALQDLAHNLWWAWNHEALGVFRRLSPEGWDRSGHNPVQMLGALRQHELEEAAADEGFQNHLRRVMSDLENYLHKPRWYQREHGGDGQPLFAYFSAEFGLTECVPIYSGGLGILAGDHLKSASDLGVPLVGLGLLYQEGYFRQYLNPDGWQQESYPDNDFYNQPLALAREAAGNEQRIHVQIGGETVAARIWRAQVGRVPLYLLDANIPDNSPAAQSITGRLYGGDQEMRIQQEILLGVGGYRALRQLGLNPRVYHMNEGHSAFLALERIRHAREAHQLGLAGAREATASGNVFTTHTPVPAGNDVFPPALMDKYFSGYYPQLGIDRDAVLGLGRVNPADPNEGFCMTVLAIRLSAYTNGVSRLHGQVSRRMWAGIWPNLPSEQAPIGHVTNGIHVPSWISRDMAELLQRYLGPRWEEDPADHRVWDRVTQIPDVELWRTHQRRRERLVAFARGRLSDQLRRRGAVPQEIERAREVLDSEALTIGFARRFATYKRATLLFRDPERLARILGDPDRPVQVIFAGKAHPRDDAGKDLIRALVHHSREERFRLHLLFLEDYDMTVARYLAQGVDLWLNTPRRLLEASGTSGMKVTPNGGLNLSILDGWWDEAHRPDTGWAIGARESYESDEYGDAVEANALYDILEQEVVPLFYDRTHERVPARWLARVKESMRLMCPVFNTNRMVHGYVTDSYLPALHRTTELRAADNARAVQLAEWKRRVVEAWPDVQIREVSPRGEEALDLDTELRVSATVHLGRLTPTDVAVELYYGPLDQQREIADARSAPAECVQSLEGNEHRYEGTVVCPRTGMFGLAVRVLPKHPDIARPYSLGLVTWSG